MPAELSGPVDLPIHLSADLNLLRHELRTPLTGILGLAEIMSAMELPAAATSCLATLQACGQQMASLIDRSLRPDQITTRASEIAATDSRCLLEQVIHSHWPAAQAGQVKLHLILEREASGYWLADSVALRQALDNLLANAIRFTYSGYVTLEAKVIPSVGEAPDSLLLIIEDTGAGLQRVENNLQEAAEFGAESGAEFADRTYPMFSRGQGLQVVEQVCHGYGGRLERYSNETGGAGFAMFLPGVLRNRDKGIKPFQFGLFKKLRCLLWLEKPLDRVIMTMLNCLDIRFEMIDVSRQSDLHSLPQYHVALCNSAKMPLPSQIVGQYAESAPLWLMAPMVTANGSELYVQQLPEPLFQADLQTALLRFLVMQGRASVLATELTTEN
ncbi:MAG: HAMP domain-containing sensor histidine kinase [Xanthomonadales bacterium]|nr:HAMP domain-containing sensor histidine kinase [Xanthomonadales bacterium]